MPQILGGAAAALLPLALLACASEPADPTAVTPEEAQQLNDAAAMLDANSVTLAPLANNGTDP